MSSTPRAPADDLDPDAFRELGYRTVDLLAEYYASLDDRPVYVQAAPETVVDAFDEPLPETGEPPGRVLDAIEDDVLQYATHNPSPRFFGSVMGGGRPTNALVDAIAAAVNLNVGGVANAEHLHERVREHADFRAVQEPNLFIYSFQYVPADLQTAIAEATGDADAPGVPLERVHQYLDRLNQGIVDDVVDSGLAFLTTTTVRDRRVLRTSICNHRTTAEDVDVVFDALADTGARLDDDWRDRASLPV